MIKLKHTKNNSRSPCFPLSFTRSNAETGPLQWDFEHSRKWHNAGRSNRQKGCDSNIQNFSAFDSVSDPVLLHKLKCYANDHAAIPLAFKRLSTPRKIFVKKMIIAVLGVAKKMFWASIAGGPQTKLVPPCRFENHACSFQLH